jgi:hypothetical protein
MQAACIAKLSGYQEILAKQLRTRGWGITTLLLTAITACRGRVATMMENVSAMRERPQVLFKALTHKGLATPGSIISITRGCSGHIRRSAWIAKRLRLSYPRPVAITPQFIISCPFSTALANSRTSRSSLLLGPH